MVLTSDLNRNKVNLAPEVSGNQAIVFWLDLNINEALNINATDLALRAPEQKFEWK